MRYKHCCKSDADSECLESFKLGIFVATAKLKAINCSSKKSPYDKFEGGLICSFIEHKRIEKQIYVQVYN